MKKLLLGVLALFLILIAVVLVAPGFIDWTARRGQIASEISSLTGRDLSIDGEIAFALLPEPTLSMSDVTLANAPGGSDPVMARVEMLDIKVAILPLLQGKIQVDSFSLVKPEILLEKLPDGKVNWDFAAGSDEEPTRKAEISLLPENGTVPEPGAGQSGDPGSQVDYFLNPDDMFSQIRLDNFSIKDGLIIYRDADQSERIEHLTAEISAGSLNGPFSLSGNARLRGITTNVSLNLGRLLKSGASTLNVTMSFPDAATRFRFNGALSNHPDRVSAHGKVGLSGDSLASSVRLFFAPDENLPPVLAQPFSLEGEITADETSFAAQKLILSVGSLTADGRVDGKLEPSDGDGEPWRVSAAFAAKHLDLDKLLELSAQQQGETPETQEEAPRPAPRAGPFDETLGDVAASLKLTADTLVFRGQVVRQMLLNAEVMPGSIDIKQATALLPGGSDIALTGQMPLGQDDSAFEGRLEAGSDNFRGLLRWLGADFPDVPANRLRKMSLSSRIKFSQNQLSTSQMDFRVDASQITGGLVIALRDRPGLGIGVNLDRFNLDAYLPLTGDESGQNNQQSNNVAGDVTDTVERSMLAWLNDFDANVNVTVGKLTIDSQNYRDIAVEATLQQGEVTFRKGHIGAYAGAQIDYRGKVGNLAATPDFDGYLDVTAEKGAQLLRALGFGLTDTLRVGQLTATSIIRGTADQFNLEGDVSIFGGELHVAGDVTDDQTKFALDLALSHPSFAQLLRRLGLFDKASRKLRQVSLKAKLEASPNQFNFTQIDGKIGNTTVAGDILLDMSKDRPKSDVKLTAGALNIAQFLPRNWGETQEDGSQPRTWSRQRFELDFLRGSDINFAISAESLKIGGIKFNQSTASASLEDGTLTLSEFSAGSADSGPHLSVSGQIAAAHNLEFDLDAAGESIQLQRLSPLYADLGPPTGPVDFQATLSSDGDNPENLISNLNGNGTIAGKLTFDSGAEKETGGTTTTENGLADVFAFFGQAFGDQKTDLESSFAIDDGVLRSGDSRIEGNGNIALSELQINLPTWQIAAVSEMYQSTSPRIPFATLTLKGPLNNPELKTDGVVPDSQVQP